VSPEKKRKLRVSSYADICEAEPYPNDDEAPPAYTQQPLPSLAANFCSSSAAGEDKYDFLRIFDTVFVIDDSSSMIGRSWRETREALEAITSICTKRDPDGIDIYFLNHQDKPKFKTIISGSTVNDIFKAVRPQGSTPTGKRLDHILQQYLHDLKKNPTMKPINIIVITDGEPSDDVESPIIATAKKLDKLNAPAWQVGIQFFQVGKSHHADKHLKQLDEEMRKISGDPELRDIVDTVAFTDAGGAKLTDEGILKVRFERRGVNRVQKLTQDRLYLVLSIEDWTASQKGCIYDSTCPEISRFSQYVVFF
jgi:uncharacterized protein YegL